MTPTRPAPETLQPETERPVFLAENGRRARMLGIGAKLAAVLTALWLVALAAGMLGFGQLPGTRIDKPITRLISGGGDEPAKKEAPSPDLASVTGSRSEGSAGARVQRSVRAETRAVRARSTRRVRRGQAQPAQTPAGQTAVAQPRNQQGQARRGFVVPPGQARKTAQPPPPPPAQPGNGYGRARKATTTPPPPPPPPGNGNGGGKK